MTSDTDQSNRLRAIFLSYIVIMSVFAGVTAFGGIAAAANAPGGAGNTQGIEGIDTDNTNSDTVSQVGSTVEVANVSFQQRGNVSNVTVELANASNSEDVDPGDIQSVGVALRNNSSDTTLASAINSSIGSNVDVNQINLSDFGATNSSNVTDVSQVVVNVTSAGNDGAIINASFEAFANDSTSDFGSDDSTGLITTQNTQTLDGGIATESTVDADEDGTPSAPTVNVSFQSVSGIDSNSVNISVRNLNVSGDNETVLVENGNVINGSATDNSNFTDGNNNNVEFANISVPTLGEGFYTVNASVNTSNGNQFTNNTLNNRNSNFSFNRVGNQLELITDSSNPLAGNFANITVVAQDDDGNRLNFNESDVNVTAGDLSLNARNNDDAQNATIDLNVSDSRRPVANTTADSPANQFDVFFNVSLSEASDLELQVRDTGTTGDVLSVGQATQTFTAETDDIELTTADGVLTADGSDTENVTLQLVDQNGDPIPRGGETVNTFVGQDNSTNAGLTRTSFDSQTNSSGISVGSFTATADGFNVSVFAEVNNQFTATTFINTVSGNISAQNSAFEIDQSTNDLSAKAGTDHDIRVTLRDSQNNAISDTSVDLSANVTGVTFADQTPQTNSSGTATTTMTLPENKQPVQINVSAGSFNASATGAAQNNVSVSAENTTALQFASDTRALPANQDDVVVTVEGADEFGNVNTTDIGSITLTSNDTDVFDFDGSESVSNSAADGTADFNVDVGASGTATLTATVANSDINNTSADFTATGPSGVDVTFTSDVSTSSNANTNSTATLNAQLVGPDGGSIGIAGETISLSASGPAELNQSGDFEPVTNADGVATYQVNATDETGQTEISANALNFSAAFGTGNITTTGPAADVSISFANDSVAQNNTTTVTTAFVDDSDRVVPRSGTINVQTIDDVGEIDSGSTASNATALANDFEATYTFNASTTESSATLRAFASGVGRTEATIDVTGTQQDQPDQPDEVTSEVNFNDGAAADGATSLTVDNATHDEDFVIVAHTATDSDGDGDIQFNNANGNNEIGTKIGSSAIQSNGTQTNIEVDLSKNVSAGDDIDSLAADDDQQIVMMLHVANESGDTNFGSNVKQADGETPVFDNNFVNVSSLDGAAGNADSDGDGEIDQTEVQNAITEFVVEETLTQEEAQDVIRAFIV